MCDIGTVSLIVKCVITVVALIVIGVIIWPLR